MYWHGGNVVVFWPIPPIEGWSGEPCLRRSARERAWEEKSNMVVRDQGAPHVFYRFLFLDIIIFVTQFLQRSPAFLLVEHDTV